MVGASEAGGGTAVPPRAAEPEGRDGRGARGRGESLGRAESAGLATGEQAGQVYPCHVVGF
jgi:hypothetical protein